MEAPKINPLETIRSLEEMVNSRQGLDERGKRDLLELAKEHGLTPVDMQEVFDMMDTEHLSRVDYGAMHPDQAKAIDKASPKAVEVYGNFQLKILDRAFETE